MASGEEGARARGRETTIEGNRGRDGTGHRGIDGRPIGAAEVADVAAHKDEGIGSRACEAGNVSDGMTWDIEEVEATVSEEIMGRESANFAVGVEGDFVDGATYEILVKYWAVLIGGIAWHEFLLESRANVEVGRRWKQRKIPCVIPVPMAPYDGIDLFVVHTTLAQ